MLAALAAGALRGDGRRSALLPAGHANPAPPARRAARPRRRPYASPSSGQPANPSPYPTAERWVRRSQRLREAAARDAVPKPNDAYLPPLPPLELGRRAHSRQAQPAASAFLPPSNAPLPRPESRRPAPDVARANAGRNAVPRQSRTTPEGSRIRRIAAAGKNQKAQRVAQGDADPSVPRL